MSFHENDLYERSSQPDESLAEISRLKSELKAALVFLKQAKAEFRPHTTNSDVDYFLARHAALLDDKPCLESQKGDELTNTLGEGS